jgi:transposase
LAWSWVRLWFVHERDVISDEVWAVIEPLLPRSQGAGRPWSDHRLTVEGVAWRFRTGAPWRDLPERFGKWNTVYKTFDRWANDGTWQQVLTAVQARSDAAGDLDWVTAVDSTITRVHQHGATLPRDTGSDTGGDIELQDSRAGTR